MGDGEQSKTWRYRMRRAFVLAFEIGSLCGLLVFRSFDREVNDPLGLTAYFAGFAMLNVVGLIPALVRVRERDDAVISAWIPQWC
jgi:hypothetical protein